MERWIDVVSCVGGVVYVVGGEEITHHQMIDTYVSDGDGLDRTGVLARESGQ
jgi:hypothetical protein